jgi:hypothetical protein
VAFLLWCHKALDWRIFASQLNSAAANDQDQSDQLAFRISPLGKFDAGVLEVSYFDHA